MAGKLVTALKAAFVGGAAWRLFGPEMPLRFRGVQEHPMRIPGRSVFVGPREFFIRETGPEDAPTLLLIHGWVYDSVGTWHRLVPLLSGRYRIVTVDHRGHGKSDRPRGRYTVEDAADDVAGVMQAAGIDRADAVVGYSMGGMIAQALAARHPGRVGRVVLAATACFPIPVRRAGTTVAFLLARAWGRLGGTIGARLSHWYLLRVGAVEPQHARWLWESLLARDVNLYFEAGSAIHRFDARSWASRLDIPALVVIPTRDQLIPPGAQYELASLLPRVDVVELVDAKHEAVLTHAGDIAKAIVEFVD